MDQRRQHQPDRDHRPGRRHDLHGRDPHRVGQRPEPGLARVVVHHPERPRRADRDRRPGRQPALDRLHPRQPRRLDDHRLPVLDRRRHQLAHRERQPDRRHRPDQRHGLLGRASAPQNVIGTGTASAPQSATPATVPSAPTITSNDVAGSGQLSVNFTAPTSNGGAAITNYQYSTDARRDLAGVLAGHHHQPGRHLDAVERRHHPAGQHDLPDRAARGELGRRRRRLGDERRHRGRPSRRPDADHGDPRLGLAAGHLHPGRERRLADHRVRVPARRRHAGRPPAPWATRSRSPA